MRTEVATLGKYTIYGAGVALLYWIFFARYPIVGFLTIVGLLSW